MKQKKEGSTTCHFTVDGDWFTWFLRHQWFEGNHYGAVRTWTSAFPHLSTINYINTIFLEIVNGTMKFEGDSEGPNGFVHAKDGTKHWNPTQGKPDKNYPLLDSWEDVLLLKQAKVYIEELHLRNYRLSRTRPTSYEECGNNTIVWQGAAEENEDENPIRKRVATLLAEIRNIGVVSDRREAALMELPESASKLITKRRGNRSFVNLEGTKGSTFRDDNHRLYAEVMKIIGPVQEYFKIKYDHDFFRYDEEEIRLICGIQPEDREPLIGGNGQFANKTKSEAFKEMGGNPDLIAKLQQTNITAMANLMIPGFNADPMKYIEDQQKMAARDTIEPEDVYDTEWQSGYIDPVGQFYGCNDIGHLDFSRRLCEQLGYTKKKEGPTWLKAKRGQPEKEFDTQIELDRRGWVKISVNRFYWDSVIELTHQQFKTAKDYMAAKKLSEALFNGTKPTTIEKGMKFFKE